MVRMLSRHHRFTESAHRSFHNVWTPGRVAADGDPNKQYMISLGATFPHCETLPKYFFTVA